LDASTVAPMAMMRASRTRARRWRVQLRLELIEIPTPPPGVWDALTGEQQAAVVALLGRLIAKTLLSHSQAKEADDAR
jgi:hypothetical protein